LMLLACRNAITGKPSTRSRHYGNDSCRIWEAFPGDAGAHPLASATTTARMGHSTIYAAFTWPARQRCRVKIPRKTYAVFSHTGHISNLHLMWQAIFSEWLPVSGCTLEEEPNFEVYTDRFDPRSGTGLVEIWIPLKEGIAA